MVSTSQTAAVVAASFILAFLTTALIEYPIRFGALTRIGAGVASASMFLVAIIAFTTWRSGGAIWRYPLEIRPVLATMNYDPKSSTRARECWLDAKTPFDDLAPACSKGAIVVWGAKPIWQLNYFEQHAVTKHIPFSQAKLRF